MRPAIQTRYAGPTNYRGARVIARAQAGRIVVPWDHALNVEDNHLAAARAFAAKWCWAGTWHGGALVDGSGYAFVMALEPKWNSGFAIAFPTPMPEGRALTGKGAGR